MNHKGFELGCRKHHKIKILPILRVKAMKHLQLFLTHHVMRRYFNRYGVLFVIEVSPLLQYLVIIHILHNVYSREEEFNELSPCFRQYLLVGIFRGIAECLQFVVAGHLGKEIVSHDVVGIDLFRIFRLMLDDVNPVLQGIQKMQFRQRDYLASQDLITLFAVHIDQKKRIVKRIFCRFNECFQIFCLVKSHDKLLDIIGLADYVPFRDIQLDFIRQITSLIKYREWFHKLLVSVHFILFVSQIYNLLFLVNQKSFYNIKNLFLRRIINNQIVALVFWEIELGWRLLRRDR